MNKSPSSFRNSPPDHTDSRDLISALLDWYRAHHRVLPWRGTGNAEDVWISEIMLQQTRVEAVKDYFTRFRAALPDACAIASCPDDALMKLWEGLGYYSRARNLKKCAEILVREYGGKLPADPELLKKLPGVGPYTAGAIASIAYGVPVPAVDGNVLRVWSRITNCAEDVSLDRTKRAYADQISVLLQGLCDDAADAPAGKASTVSDFNQALMELGAVVCVPNGAPQCGSCPVRPFCRAAARGTAEQLPVKAAKNPRRVEQRTVLVLRDGERFYFRKRPEKGLLAGLYEFPGFPGHLSPDEAVDTARSLGADPVRVTSLPDGRHIFTHVEWDMRAYEVQVSGFPEEKNGILPVTREELRSFAVPSAFRTWTDWYSLNH